LNYESLKLSDNRKVKFFPKHFNTYGLMNGPLSIGGTCPGATEGEYGCLAILEGRSTITCYVDKLKRIYPNKGNVLAFNTELINKPYDELVIILRNTFLKFLLNNGYKAPYFRLNDCGDVLNENYANALKTVILEYPNIQFWIYTRSLFALPILANCNNLALYLSIDPENKDQVLEAYKPYHQYKNIALAMMSDNNFIPEMKFVRCPELSGHVPNTPEQGACSKCRLCFKYNNNIKLRNIRFDIH
jgi:hypothetical protein